MIPEEFKALFKVGDIVSRGHEGIKITAIGDTHFLGFGVVQEGVFEIEGYYEWAKVEPKKKPSEEIDMIAAEAQVSAKIKGTYYDYALYAVKVWLDKNHPV